MNFSVVSRTLYKGYVGPKKHFGDTKRITVKSHEEEKEGTKDPLKSDTMNQGVKGFEEKFDHCTKDPKDRDNQHCTPLGELVHFFKSSTNFETQCGIMDKYGRVQRTLRIW
jgi:hypothetical protein